MLWRGLRRSDQKSRGSRIPTRTKGGANEYCRGERHYDYQARAIHEIGTHVQRARRSGLGGANRAISFVGSRAGTPGRISFLGDAWTGWAISGRRDTAGYLSESICDTDRRGNGRHRVLGQAYRRGAVPDFRGELRAPGLSGALVPAIGSVSLPVPWGRLLPRRGASGRTAGARVIHVSAQSRKRCAVNPGW